MKAATSEQEEIARMERIKKNKFLTLILTDRFFLLTYNMIEEPMMVKVRDVSSCEVHIENDMYSVTFIMTS